MDLRALRYFQFVAELRSFSKAAVQLRVAQPAVSRQVQKLEDELGVALFDRRRRGIELTAAGAILLQRARSLLGQVGQIVDEVRSHAGAITGTVTIGAPPTIGDLILPSVLEECGRHHPGLVVEIVESSSPQLYERLLNNELSLCILHNPQPHREIEIESLLVDQLYLIGPGRETRGLRPVDETYDLESLPMILPRPPYNRRVVIDEICAAHGIELDVRLSVDGFTIIRALVEQGFGYSILSYYGIYEMCRDGRLSAVKLRNPSMSWMLAVASRQDLAKSAAILEVKRLLYRSVQAVVDEGKWLGDPVYVAREAAAPGAR